MYVMMVRGVCHDGFIFISMDAIVNRLAGTIIHDVDHSIIGMHLIALGCFIMSAFLLAPPYSLVHSQMVQSGSDLSVRLKAVIFILVCPCGMQLVLWRH